MYIHYFAHAKLYFCSHFLILVYVMYFIYHTVSNCSFFCVSFCFMRKLFYTWIKLQIFIVLTIKRLIVLYFASLHLIEYRFTLILSQKLIWNVFRTYCSNLNNFINFFVICIILLIWIYIYVLNFVIFSRKWLHIPSVNKMNSIKILTFVSLPCQIYYINNLITWTSKYNIMITHLYLMEHW